MISGRYNRICYTALNLTQYVKMKTKALLIANILISVLSTQAAVLLVDNTVNNHSTVASYDTITIQNGGVLNLTGGAVTVPVQSQSNNAAKIFVNSGSTLNFVDGVHTLNERISTGGATPTIRITGSAATINVHQQGNFYANMDFVFDTAGISTFDSDSRLGFSSSTITINASAYTGGDATFVLVDTELFGATYANNGGGFGTIGTIIAPTGFTATLDQSLFDGDDDAGFTGEITLTIAAVPEPSSTALLGLGGLALILRRRK